MNTVITRTDAQSLAVAAPFIQVRLIRQPDLREPLSWPQLLWGDPAAKFAVTSVPREPSEGTAVSIVSRRKQRVAGEELIRSLYELHGRSLLAYTTRLTGDRAAAEDVVQETLLRAWKHRDVFENRERSGRGWLLTVARNIVIDRARAKSSRPPEVAETMEAPSVEPDYAQNVVDSMTILGAMDGLSPEHRDVLVEVYYRGRTVAEAAEQLGVAPGTVKSRSHYALRALREIMSGMPVSGRPAKGGR